MVIIALPGLTLFSGCSAPSPELEAKAAIVDQLYSLQPNQAFIQQTTQELEDYGFVDIYQGEEVTVEQVNQAFRVAAEGALAGILEYCQDELVSMDFKGNPASSIVDAPSTMVIAGNMVKVVAWYDNEWGYSCRLADVSAYIADKGL